MKKKTYVKVLLILAAFVGLMFISEGIYVLRNNNEVKMRLYLNLSLLSARASKMKFALTFLEKAADIKRSQLDKDYPQIETNSKLIVTSFTENGELLESYQQAFKNLDTAKLTSSNDSWGKLFYNLGLLAYKYNEPQLVDSLWQSAVNIAPEWSYFHIELANFYLSTDQKLKATESLGYCLKFNFPKNHCQIYLEENFYSNSPEKVGFLEKLIKKKI